VVGGRFNKAGEGRRRKIWQAWGAIENHEGRGRGKIGGGGGEKMVTEGEKELVRVAVGKEEGEVLSTKGSAVAEAAPAEGS